LIGTQLFRSGLIGDVTVRLLVDFI